MKANNSNNSNTNSNKNSSVDTLYFRFAEEKDCKLLFDWRNDPEVRNNSGDSSELVYNNHKEWFFNALKNKDVVILLAINDNSEEVGQVRLNISKSQGIISISLDKSFRGNGYGTYIIKKASSIFLNNFHIKSIIAKIRKENLASVKSFEKAGYKYLREEGGFKYYVFKK
ncbi:RimJ/RimL family protein N-acetyltransferase [Methanococcus voltae]|uniref:RimJ/RimL family protein N-acetyltransferase n=1 Tax=Methanococcus voltae TaxID=2188 RepID=A0A8J7S113_METVO|nr:GNAT family N-acetyltransferase [Methanococcus voltae]MBP2201425.1 RimJ/RimL family protein N-acetyltransferase [Methanococcus voltae]